MSDRPAGRPANDIYTLLTMLATVVVAAATIYLAIKSEQFFGSWNPFSGA